MSDGGFFIEPAGPGDAPAVSRLIGAAARALFPHGELPAGFAASLAPEALAVLFAEATVDAFVARDGGRVVGVIVVRDGVHVHHLFVAPDRQGGGIARALWEKAQAAMGSGPCFVRASLVAVPVYERFGFVATGPAEEKGGLVFVAMRRPPR